MTPDGVVIEAPKYDWMVRKKPKKKVPELYQNREVQRSAKKHRHHDCYTKKYSTAQNRFKAFAVRYALYPSFAIKRFIQHDNIVLTEKDVEKYDTLWQFLKAHFKKHKGVK